MKNKTTLMKKRNIDRILIRDIRTTKGSFRYNQTDREGENRGNQERHKEKKRIAIDSKGT